MDEKNLSSGQSPTPYDDVFRTMLIDCKKLVIPVINEVFGENYTGDEDVVFRQNEHFKNQQDGMLEKIITDSSFQIVGKTTKKYLFECQSTEDNSMLIRIFEYATQIALEDDRSLVANKLIVTIPHSALLLLRSSKNSPDSLVIEIQTPGGDVEFSVPVMKVRNYTIEDVFEKDLFFLIPFYIFVYESQFSKMEEQGEGLNELKDDYRRIFDLLDEATRNGEITAYTRKTIFEMSNKVLEKIAVKYDKVMEGVKSVMGGRVLEHEAKDILNEGRAEGRAEGEEKGKKAMALSLYNQGVALDVIATAAGVAVAVVKKWLGLQPA